MRDNASRQSESTTVTDHSRPSGDTKAMATTARSNWCNVYGVRLAISFDIVLTAIGNALNSCHFAFNG